MKLEITLTEIDNNLKKKEGHKSTKNFAIWYILSIKNDRRFIFSVYIDRFNFILNQIKILNPQK